MSLNTAIARIQTLALSSTDINITNAPEFPLEDLSGSLPLAITYLKSGQAQADDATASRLLLTVGCDVHFSRQNVGFTYKQIQLFVPEFLRRLSGDPSLNSTAQTIVFPILFQVLPAQFNAVITQMVSFDITLKFREAAIV